MSQYKIERWDVVMFGNSTTRVPMIYIKPDMTFLDFVRNNNYAVVCHINGTGTVYDGKEIPGVVDKSCFVPNCRPNFCEKTGFYVVTLWANWYGYPEPGKLGSVSFSGLKAAPDNSYTHSGPKHGAAPTPKYATKVEPEKGMSTKDIGLIVAGIVFVLIVVILLARFLKK